MSQVNIATTQNVDIHFEAANPLDRMLSYFIDMLVLYGYFSVVGIIAGIAATSLMENDAIGMAVVIYVLLYLPPVLYPLLCEIMLNGQTLGKRALKIRVLRLDGTQPTVGNYVVRWLTGLFEISLFPAIALLTTVASKRHQRLGDMAAGTTVVRLAPKVSLDMTFVSDGVDDAYQPRFPQVRLLTEQDAETLRDLLTVIAFRRISRDAAISLTWRAKERLEEVYGLRSDLVPVELIRAVVADYNAVNGRMEWQPS